MNDQFRAQNVPDEVLLPDTQVVRRVLGGEVALFEILMRRHNQRVFRAARAIVRDDDEAEDVMQDAYVRAYRNLGQFEGRAAFSTWLIRIAVHEAQARLRRQHRLVPLPAQSTSSGSSLPELVAESHRPDEEAHGRELGGFIAAAVEALPQSHRLVFVLRSVEGLSTAETSECLGISEENVRVRLHRARSLLRRDLEARLGDEAQQLYPFHLPRCDRVVRGVFLRIDAQYRLS